VCHCRCVTPFKELDMSRFRTSLSGFVATIASLHHISENLSDVDGLAIMAAEGPRGVLKMIQHHSNAVARYLEALSNLRHPGMRDRHWVQFFALFEVRNSHQQRPEISLVDGEIQAKSLAPRAPGASLTLCSQFQHTVPVFTNTGDVPLRIR
jgi:hypothetical protein